MKTKDIPIPLSPDGHLEYLSRTALEFVSLSPETDVYHHVATRLEPLLGDAVIVVCSYDTDTRELCQRALVGVGPWLDSLSSMAGTQLRGFKRVLTAEAEQQISVGRLLKVEEGLYEALLRSVPRPVTQAIEKVAGIRAVYGMGCCAGGRCFGSILMLLRTDNGMPPVSVVEAYVGQAALAMQKVHAEAALRRSEEQFRILMARATDACLIVTTEGVIRDINEGGSTALGYTRSSLIGRPVTVLFNPDELIAKPIPWDRIRRGEVFVETRHLRRSDGTLGLFEGQVTMLSEGRVMVVARDITERRRLEAEVAESCRREREAMGRELHDSLGQQLTGISCLCASLGQRLAERGVPEAAEADRVASLLGESVGQVRRIAQGLCPVDVAPYGISVALSNLASRMSAMHGVRCQYTQDGGDVVLQEQTASHLYLIAQEAISNAVRHGGADTIEMELRIEPRLGMLSIRDNGCGFVVPLRPHPGLGLRIMKYRSDMIEGSVDVTSSPSGTTVQCTFPLSK